MYQKFVIRFIFICFSLLFIMPQSAFAADITADGTTCTLIDAITAANTDTVTGGCLAGAGADTITLTADVILTTGLPAITTTSVITIEGAGFTISRSSASPILVALL